MGFSDWTMEYTKGIIISRLVNSRMRNTTAVPAAERFACRPVPRKRSFSFFGPPHAVKCFSTRRMTLLKSVIIKNRNTAMAKAYPISLRVVPISSMWVTRVVAA